MLAVRTISGVREMREVAQSARAIAFVGGLAIQNYSPSRG